MSNARGTFALGMDVLALAVVAVFTFGMTASLIAAHNWIELGVFAGLAGVGVYLTGRAVLNLKARLTQDA